MPSKTQSIVVGALVVGLLSTSVLGFINFLCCAGVIIGALVGVWHYTTTHGLTISAGQGVLIGVLAAVLGAIAAEIVNYLLGLAGLDLVTELTIAMYERIGLPQEQLDQMRAQTQNQSFAMVLLGIGINTLLAAVFGAIGGAIGASVFKRGGDTPGGGPSGGGSGGPRVPEGDRNAPSGPRERRPTGGGEGQREASAYRPPQQASMRPAREEEPAPQGA